MEQVQNLEVKLAHWYKQLPQLPTDVRQWLAHNIWWLAAIGALLSGLACIGVIFGVLFASVGLTLFGAAAAGVVGAAVGATLSGLIIVTTVIFGFVFAVQTLLLGMAVTPLRELKKHGWNLVFYITLIELICNSLAHIISFNVFALIATVFWSGVMGYFLFEVREYFVVKKSHAHHKAKEAEIVK